MQKLKFLRPALSLVVIAVGVALLLALINSVTRDRIAENALADKKAAIEEIFPDIASFESDPSATLPTSVLELGRVKGSDNALIGYYAEIAPMGFKSTISMIVGISPEYKVVKVVCLASSETAGVGTKATQDGYLSLFGSLDADGAAGVDTITGATISSKAVRLGITEACRAASLLKEVE